MNGWLPAPGFLPPTVVVTLGAGQDAERRNDETGLVVQGAGIREMGNAMFSPAHRPQADQVKTPRLQGQCRVFVYLLAPDIPRAFLVRTEGFRLAADEEGRAKFFASACVGNINRMAYQPISLK